MDTYKTLNEVLVNLFRDVMDIEQKAIITEEFQDGKEDRRVVYISLTERGRAAYVHHARFHKAMIDSISDELTSEEMELLIKTLTKLNKWFRNWQEN